MALVRRSRGDMRPGDNGYINVPEGETMKTLEGHTDGVICVIQLFDGRLVSGGIDTTLRIWDTISGSCLMTLEGHMNSVWCVIQLADGRLVSGSFDYTLRIWDTISGSCLMTLEGHINTVACLIQLTDGRLVSSSDDNTLKVWDTISGSCLMTLHGHTNIVCYVIQLTDGRLVSGSADDTIKVWNIMSLSQQKWIRRRLLALLFEASKILSDSPEFDMINPEQYRRRQDLELLLRCSLNISNNKINLKAFKITRTVISIPEIAILIAEYL